MRPYMEESSQGNLAKPVWRAAGVCMEAGGLLNSKLTRGG